MQLRQLGSTEISISPLAFGAGPVSALMTGDNTKLQIAVLRQVLDAGINWIDTAATYGTGQSETNLGRALHKLDATNAVHIATKVRLLPEDLDDIPATISSSVEESLARLGVEQVTLLQLHNSITQNRGDEPTSVTPADVLAPGGIADCLEQLRSKNQTQHIGLTLIGQPEPLKEVIHSGRFATAQVPYNVLNPSAGADVSVNFSETNYGNVIAACAKKKMGVLAIRVFAGGSLVGQPPSDHTLKTKFFPLDLYQRDLQRSQQLQSLLPDDMDIKELAIRYILTHPQIASSIVGFGAPEHVNDAVAAVSHGALPPSLLERLPR